MTRSDKIMNDYVEYRLNILDPVYDYQLIKEIFALETLSIRRQIARYRFILGLLEMVI